MDREIAMRDNFHSMFQWNLKSKFIVEIQNLKNKK